MPLKRKAVLACRMAAFHLRRPYSLGGGALEWKMNGAGGERGSVAILNGAPSRRKHEMIRAHESANRPFRNIPICRSRHGLRPWERCSV